jgi:hypothetical protein
MYERIIFSLHNQMMRNERGSNNELLEAVWWYRQRNFPPFTRHFRFIPRVILALK